MFVVKTSVIEDYVEVVEFALSSGLKWRDGSINILEEQWYDHKENTCVVANEYISFCDDGYCRVFNLHILNMEHFYRYIKIKKLLKLFI